MTQANSTGKTFFAMAVGSRLEILKRDGSEEICDAKRLDLCSYSQRSITPENIVRGAYPSAISSVDLTDKSHREIKKNWLKSVSEGINFEEEVVFDRSAFLLPYNAADHWKLFKGKKKCKDIGNNRQNFGGRHNSRCPEAKHMPCHLQFTSKIDHACLLDQLAKSKNFKSSLQPVKRSTETHKLPDTSRRDHNAGPRDTGDMPLSFSFETSQSIQTKAEYTAVKPKNVKSHSWDEYLVSLLSKDTAKLIANEYTHGKQSSKLDKFLDNYHRRKIKGLGDETKVTALLSSDISNAALCDETSQPKVSCAHNADGSNVNEAESRKHFGSQDNKEGEMAVHDNNTTLQFDKKRHCAKIAEDSSDLQHVVQQSYPILPSIWSSGGDDIKHSKRCKGDSELSNKVVKGMKKWTDYPKDFESIAATEMKIISTSPVQPAAKINLETVKQHQENLNLVRIAEDWRSQWFLEKRWEDSTLDQISEAMQSINDHTRLAAVSACGKAVLNGTGRGMTKKQTENKAECENLEQKPSRVKDQEAIIKKIQKLLNDHCNQVRIAAAISLFTLNCGNEKAKSILLEALRKGGIPDKWAAAQCLAYTSCTHDAVLIELIKNVNSVDIVKSYKAAKLLADLSESTGSIQFMLAEQLNSCSWRDRATACQLFPLLKDGVSKDISSKLSHLMWYDWSKEVRVASARALGRTGNGKLVHDKLKERLSSGKEAERIDALRKIANLGIITNRLLPHIVSCLQDDYVSVRLEAIRTAAEIKLTDEEALEILIKLASEDRSWKVKAFAVKALGQIQKRTEKIHETLLWTLRYESEPAVRAEACHSIGLLKYADDETIRILQDRVVVEESDIVRLEVTKVLKRLGQKPTGDLSMHYAVKNEVKRLCNRQNIAKFILKEEEDEEYLLSYEKYIKGDVDQGHQLEDNKQLAVGLDQGSLKPQVQDRKNIREQISEDYKLQRDALASLYSLPVTTKSLVRVDIDISSSEGELASSEDNFSEDEDGTDLASN